MHICFYECLHSIFSVFNFFRHVEILFSVRRNKHNKLKSNLEQIKGRPIFYRSVFFSINYFIILLYYIYIQTQRTLIEIRNLHSKLADTPFPTKKNVTLSTF